MVDFSKHLKRPAPIPSTSEVNKPIPDIKEPWNKGGYMANVNDPSRGIHADLVIQDDVITTPISEIEDYAEELRNEWRVDDAPYDWDEWILRALRAARKQTSNNSIGETYEQLCRMHKTDLIELLRAARKPQLWIANTDKVPSLSTKPHEICDPITAEEVVKMWDTLKSHYLALQEECKVHKDRYRSVETELIEMQCALKKEIEKNEEKYLIATNPNPDQRPSCGY